MQTSPRIRRRIRAADRPSMPRRRSGIACRAADRPRMPRCRPAEHASPPIRHPAGLAADPASDRPS
jgi:hypothetical protein